MPYYQQLAEFEQPTSVPPVVPAPIAPAAPTSDVAPWGEGPNWTGIAVVAGAALLLYCMSGKDLRRNDTVDEQEAAARQRIKLIRDNLHLFGEFAKPGDVPSNRLVAQYPTALNSHMNIRLNQMYGDGFYSGALDIRREGDVTKIYVTDEVDEMSPDEASEYVDEILTLIDRSRRELMNEASTLQQQLDRKAARSGYGK